MSETPIDRAPAPFVTFYSFKGGVGRSMALINVAGILAGRGFRVLTIDMDLEAPGISYLIPSVSDAQSGGSRVGFVELLADAVARGPEADLFALDPKEVVARYSGTFQVPEQIRKNTEGCLRIMSAGRFDGGYQRRLDELDLPGLYRDGLGKELIQAFKRTLQDSHDFDFVLVDSRTGFSDESGICTRDLADHLMVVTGLNSQNIEGTAEFLRVLRLASEGRKSLRIILSPVPTGEDDLVDQRERIAKAKFAEAWGEELDLALQIPYHPRLALTEEPHIFRRSRGYLFDAYVAIERELLELLGLSVASVIARANRDVRAQRYDDALFRSKLALKLDGGRIALERVADALMDAGRSDSRADALYAFLAKELPDLKNRLADHAKALFILWQQDEAREVLCRAFAVHPVPTDDTRNGTVLSELHFYAYAHAWNEWPEALGRLKGLLSGGARSKKWGLDANVERARKQGHPEPDLVAALASVLSEKDPMETLERFPTWTETPSLSPLER